MRTSASKFDKIRNPELKWRVASRRKIFFDCRWEVAAFVRHAGDVNACTVLNQERLNNSQGTMQVDSYDARRNGACGRRRANLCESMLSVCACTYGPPDGKATRRPLIRRAHRRTGPKAVLFEQKEWRENASTSSCWDLGRH
eukprot:6175210-Pleurochrysis_carterae.AAC.2